MDSADSWHRHGGAGACRQPRAGFELSAEVLLYRPTERVRVEQYSKNLGVTFTSSGPSTGNIGMGLF